MLGESSHCEIRPGAPADAPALSDVFRSSWSNAYLGIIPHLHLDSMIRKRTPDWWGATIKAGGELLVLQVAGVVAGYATLGPARVRGEYEGEIYEIYVSPTYQGLGFGERLFEACRYHLDVHQLCWVDRMGAGRQHGRIGLLLAPRRAPGQHGLRALRPRQAEEAGFRLGLTGSAAETTHPLDARALLSKKHPKNCAQACLPIRRVCRQGLCGAAEA